MKQMQFILVAVMLSLATPAIPVFAHHSFANYDMKTNTTLEGVVTRFEWTNPHTYLHVNVPDGNGGVVEWAIEFSALGHLLRDGWTKDTFKPGDKVTVIGHLARSGAKLMTYTSITTGDGRSYKSGQAAPPAPAPKP